MTFVKNKSGRVVDVTDEHGKALLENPATGFTKPTDAEIKEAGYELPKATKAETK